MSPQEQQARAEAILGDLAAYAGTLEEPQRVALAACLLDSVVKHPEMPRTQIGFAVAAAGIVLATATQDHRECSEATAYVNALGARWRREVLS